MKQEVQNEEVFVSGNYEDEIEEGLIFCKNYTDKLIDRVNLNIS